LKAGLHETLELLYLGVGDRGRLEHIKQQLEAQHELYDSDQQYLNNLTIKYQDEITKHDKTETIEDKESEWKEDEISQEEEELKNNFCSNCGNKIDKQNFCSNCGLEINKKITKDTIPSKKSTEKKHSSDKGRNSSIAVVVIVLLVGFSILLLAGIETVSENDRTSDASLASIISMYDEDDKEVRIVLTFTDGDNGETVRTTGKMDLSIQRTNYNSDPVYSKTYTFNPDDFRTYSRPMIGVVTSYVFDIDKDLNKGKYYVIAQIELSDGSKWKDLSDSFTVW
jgi:hypothetical protein